MAITRIGLRLAEKSRGEESGGTKVYIVTSDENIGDDIDQILDATIDANNRIPEYSEYWSPDSTSLWVSDKRAVPHDERDGYMDGYVDL